MNNVQAGSLQSFAQNNKPYSAPITNAQNTGNSFAAFYSAKPQVHVEKSIEDDLKMTSSENDSD